MSKLFLLTLFLIFFAEKFRSYPFFIASILILISLFTLVSLPQGANKKYYKIIFLDKIIPSFFYKVGVFINFVTYFNRLKKSYSKVFFLLLCLSFAWSPFYFSDDALRHIHDGHYLLKGVDVYRLAPSQLAPVTEQSPNHPDIQSIYLPVTQLQAVLGAYLDSCIEGLGNLTIADTTVGNLIFRGSIQDSRGEFLNKRIGFRLVYIIICLLLMGLTWSLATRYEKGFWLSLWLSPYFLIFFSSHHADVQGFLILTCISSIFYFDFAKIKHILHMPLICLSAFLASFLAGLKPEGSFWLLYLLIFFAVKTFIYSNDSKNIYFKKWIWCIKINAVFLFGLCLGITFQLTFTWYYLFKGIETLSAFLDTVRLFANWFLAYNPILELRVILYENGAILRSDIFSHYRNQVYLIILLCFCIIPALFVQANFRLSKNKDLSCLRPRDFTVAYLQAVLYIALFASFVLKGTWNPWYFLWIFPAFFSFINLNKRTYSNFMNSRFINFVLIMIPIFYIPIVFLRSGMSWNMNSFYLTFLSIALLYFIKLFFELSLKKKLAFKIN